MKEGKREGLFLGGCLVRLRGGFLKRGFIISYIPDSDFWTDRHITQLSLAVKNVNDESVMVRSLGLFT